MRAQTKHKKRVLLVSTKRWQKKGSYGPLLHVCAEQHLHRMTDVQPADKLLVGAMAALTMPGRGANSDVKVRSGPKLSASPW